MESLHFPIQNVLNTERDKRQVLQQCRVIDDCSSVLKKENLSLPAMLSKLCNRQRLNSFAFLGTR